MRARALTLVLLTLAACGAAEESTCGPKAASPSAVYSLAPDQTAPTLLGGPVLSHPTTDRVTIWWHVSKTEKSHAVDVQEPGKPMRRFLYEGPPTAFPVVRMTGLSPATTYIYRVRSGATTYGPYPMQTLAADGPMRLAVWGDNQEGCATFTRETVPPLQTSEPDVLLNVGDLVGNGEQKNDWLGHLFGPAKALLWSTPWLPTRGNHDEGNWLADAMLPTPDGTDGWYLHRVRDIAVLVLNSTETVDEASPQGQWLKTALASAEWKEARFRIATFHHPPYNEYWHDDSYDGSPDIRIHVVPRLQMAKADLILNGHAHRYERGALKLAGHVTHFVTTGGGGGAIDEVPVTDWPHIEKSIGRHHIILIDVDEDEMRVRAIGLDGEVFDEFRIPATGSFDIRP